MGAGRRVVPAGGGDHQCEGAAVALPHTVARRFRWAARLLASAVRHDRAAGQLARHPGAQDGAGTGGAPAAATVRTHAAGGPRSEEHTSELQTLMRLSYAVFCLKNKNSFATILTTQR